LEPERPEAVGTAAVGGDQPQERLSSVRNQQQPPASGEEPIQILPEEAVLEAQAGTPQPPDDSYSASGVDLFDNNFTTAV
jgi:hypothetical protein